MQNRIATIEATTNKTALEIGTQEAPATKASSGNIVIEITQADGKQPDEICLSIARAKLLIDAIGRAIEEAVKL